MHRRVNDRTVFDFAFQDSCPLRARRFSMFQIDTILHVRFHREVARAFGDLLTFCDLVLSSADVSGVGLQAQLFLARVWHSERSGTCSLSLSCMLCVVFGHRASDIGVCVNFDHGCLLLILSWLALADCRRAEKLVVDAAFDAESTGALIS